MTVQNVTEYYPTSADKIYLAGPMSGIEGYNLKGFNMFAKHLREQGLDIVNPAELAVDDGTVAGSHPWEYYVKYDLKFLLECNSMILIPGWRDSRGVRLELTIAATLKYKVYLIGEDFRLKMFEEDGFFAVPYTSR